MSKTENNKIEAQTMGELVRALVNEYGRTLYKTGEKSRFKNLLADFSTGFPKESNLLGIAIGGGVSEQFLVADGKGDDERLDAIVRCRLSLIDNYGMAENAALEVAFILADGLGWNVSQNQVTARLNTIALPTQNAQKNASSQPAPSQTASLPSQTASSPSQSASTTPTISTVSTPALTTSSATPIRKVNSKIKWAISAGVLIVAIFFLLFAFAWKKDSPTVSSDPNRSKYESYVFSSQDECVNYFLSTEDWSEKIKCCNFPDSAAVLLNAIKIRAGNDFLKYKKIDRKEKLENGQTLYFIKGGNYDELRLLLNDEKSGYRIALWGSWFYNTNGTEHFGPFSVDKSMTTTCTYGCDFDTDVLTRGKYNKENSYCIFMLNTTGKGAHTSAYVAKDSKIGKRIFEIMKDGYSHRLCLDLAWDTDNYNQYSSNGKKYHASDVVIITGIHETIDAGNYYDDSLTKLEQNYVPFTGGKK